MTNKKMYKRLEEIHQIYCESSHIIRNFTLRQIGPILHEIDKMVEINDKLSSAIYSLKMEFADKSNNKSDNKKVRKKNSAVKEDVARRVDIASKESKSLRDHLDFATLSKVAAEKATYRSKRMGKKKTLN